MPTRWRVEIHIHMVEGNARTYSRDSPPLPH